MGSARPRGPRVGVIWVLVAVGVAGTEPQVQARLIPPTREWGRQRGARPRPRKPVCRKNEGVGALGCEGPRRAGPVGSPGPSPNPPAAILPSHVASAPFLPCMCGGGKFSAMDCQDPTVDQPPQPPKQKKQEVTRKSPTRWHRRLRKPLRCSPGPVPAGGKRSACKGPQGLWGGCGSRTRGPGQVP